MLSNLYTVCIGLQFVYSPINFKYWAFILYLVLCNMRSSSHFLFFQILLVRLVILRGGVNADQSRLLITTKRKREEKISFSTDKLYSKLFFLFRSHIHQNKIISYILCYQRVHYNSIICFSISYLKCIVGCSKFFQCFMLLLLYNI